MSTACLSAESSGNIYALSENYAMKPEAAPPDWDSDSKNTNVQLRDVQETNTNQRVLAGSLFPVDAGSVTSFPSNVEKIVSSHLHFCFSLPSQFLSFFEQVITSGSFLDSWGEEAFNTYSCIYLYLLLLLINIFPLKQPLFYTPYIFQGQEVMKAIQPTDGNWPELHQTGPLYQ